jgi:hypothetical protein
LLSPVDVSAGEVHTHGLSVNLHVAHVGRLFATGPDDKLLVQQPGAPCKSARSSPLRRCHSLRELGIGAQSLEICLDGEINDALK